MNQKVGPGRQHEVDVIAKSPLVGARPGAKAYTWRYQAQCTCGWRGVDRASVHAAHDDELAHMEAEE